MASSKRTGLSDELADEMDSELPEEWDTVELWASEAVRGANDWLVTIRNAEDEGIDPWSDQYANDQTEAKTNDTDQDSGILSYSEGLTALTLTDTYAKKYGWLQLQPNIYAKDIKQIIGITEKSKAEIRGILTEDGEPGYTPAPYMDQDLTNHFTDAVSFSTSVLMGALDTQVNITQEGLEENDITDALEQNLDWLLKNGIETEDRIGWSWIGSDAPNYVSDDDSLHQPHNYFTYSAVIALVDFYIGGTGDEANDKIKQMAEDRKGDLISTLEGATEFLLNENWTSQAARDDAWTLPGEPTEANLMMTCYTIIALSYIDYNVKEIDVKTEKVNKSMNYVWGEIQRKEKAESASLWDLKQEYTCNMSDQSGSAYTDGSGPYLLLDAVYEFLNYELGDVSEVASKDEMEDWANKFAQRILLKCWAGDEGFPQKGFRHLGAAAKAEKSPSENPTAIYTTGVAIETFLTNVLQGEIKPPSVNKEGGDGETESESIGVTDDSPTSKPVQDKTINIIYDGEDGDNGDDGTDSNEITHQLESIQSDVKQLTKEIPKIASEETAGALDERSLEFMQQINDLAMILSEEYTINQGWKSDICQELSKAKQSLSSSKGGDWAPMLKRINKDNFITYLGQVYFCSNKEKYEEDVKLSESDTNLLLPPQHNIAVEINNKDSDFFADSNKRRNYLEQAVGDMIANPWGEEDMPDAMHEFEQRYKNEVMGD